MSGATEAELRGRGEAAAAQPPVPGAGRCQSDRWAGRPRSGVLAVAAVCLLVAGAASGHGETELEQGLAALRAGQPEDAIAAYTRAIDSGTLTLPELLSAYTHRCAAQEAAAQHRQAVSDCNAAIQLGSTAAAVFSLRGAAHQGLGRRDAAVADFERAVRLDPDLAAAHYSLGNLRLDGGDPAGAIESYSRAVAAQPDLAAAWHNRGFAHAQRSEWNAAVADYVRCYELGTRSDRAIFNLQDALHQLGLYSGPLDGAANAQLEAAVRAFRSRASAQP